MNDMEKNQVSESEDFAAMLEETMVKFLKVLSPR